MIELRKIPQLDSIQIAQNRASAIKRRESGADLVRGTFSAALKRDLAGNGRSQLPESARCVAVLADDARCHHFRPHRLWTERHLSLRDRLKMLCIFLVHLIHGDHVTGIMRVIRESLTTEIERPL